MHVTAAGVPLNIKEGIRLICIAAEMGYDCAEYMLGVHYGMDLETNNSLDITGAEVTKKLREALKWFLRAAKQGNVEAMICAGKYLMKFSELKKDYSIPGCNRLPRAACWFQKAAKLGNEEAAQLMHTIRSDYSMFCANLGCDKHQTGRQLFRCSKCKVMHYCSKECQIRHWKRGHKNECIQQEP